MVPFRNTATATRQRQSGHATDSNPQQRQPRYIIATCSTALHRVALAVWQFLRRKLSSGDSRHHCSAAVSRACCLRPTVVNPTAAVINIQPRGSLHFFFSSASTRGSQGRPAWRRDSARCVHGAQVFSRMIVRRLMPEASGSSRCTEVTAAP